MTDGADEATRKVPTPGSSYGPYTIVESLGAGGMGEVFRARDARLNRHVALKFLPDELRSDEQLIQRFEREAKLLALVSHPNIATIHSIEDGYEDPFLVLELVEGETLAKILESGPLPLHEALRVCRDVAGALEAAHRKGIVHRDLKPANVMVTGDGVVKVLDFGIAKPVRYGEAASDLEQTPSQELTAAGTIIGTGPYMSPEQVRGKSAGRRADIWGFGCLMYQALTGKAAFGRDTLADTLTSILEREPDWSLLPAKTPESIRRLLKRCVQKDPSQRLQAIGDARIEIEETIRTPSGAAEQASADPIPRWQLVAGAAAILAIGILIGVWIIWPPPTPPPTPKVYDFVLPPDVVLGLGGAPSIAVSRDGTRFAAVLRDGSSPRLYKRDLSGSSGWMEIPGTDGAEGPFFSWDGDGVGYFAHGRLHWVPYDISSEPEELVDAPEPFGGAWAPDGTIYFSSNQSIWTTRTDIRGASELITFDSERGEIGLRWPQVLPDGETLLYTSWFGAGSADSSLNLRRSNGDTLLLWPNAGYARYSPSFHIVFTRGEELFAVPFDPNSLTTTGNEIPRSDDVLVRGDIGVPFFALASQAGTFVHAPGGVLTPGPVLAWMKATARSVPEPLILGTYHEMLHYPRLSSDGTELAITIEEGSGDEESEGRAYAGIVSLGNSGSAQPNAEPIVDGDITYGPEWGPDGATIAYFSFANMTIDTKASHTGGAGSPLTEADVENLGTPLPTGWSATGLVFYNVPRYSESVGTMESDILYVDTSRRTDSPRTFLATDANEYGAVPSPSGELIAYVRRPPEGDEESTVMVSLFRDPNTRIFVSPGTDCQEPTWAADDSRLFFRCDTEMWVADIRTAPRLEADRQRALWNWPFALDAQSAKANYAYDVLQKKFLMVSEEPIVTAVYLKVVDSWHESLRAGARR